MVFNVFPLSWCNKCFTFSRKTTFGFFVFAISNTLKNKVPRVSKNPFCFPEIENGWQGKPAHKTSWSGIDNGSTKVISPTKFFSNRSSKIWGDIFLWEH